MNRVTCRALFMALALSPTAALAEMSDSGILNKIHNINQDEIQTAQQVLGKSENREVESFGERMIRDHGKADKMAVAFSDRRHEPFRTPLRTD